MKRRAFVVASETGLLLGANRDAERMAARLSASGFDVDLRKGEAATRDGILEGYGRLIAACQPGDAAVVYYSGHGSFSALPEGVEASGPFSRRRYQAIVPFDYAASTPTSYRGILAEELSILLYKLTQRTANVAVLLDCCHAALMSRDPRVVPKALPHPLHVGVKACLDSILATEDASVVEAALGPNGSSAVRLIACQQDQSAYERVGPDGKECGVFTEGVLTALDEADKIEVTWRDIAQRAAEYVVGRFGVQLPGVEGSADRLLFDTKERGREGAAPIVETLRGWVVRRGRVFNVHVGDVYSIVPPLGAARGEIGRAKVTRVGAVDSAVEIEAKHGAAIPEGARGVPVEWAEPPRLVRVPEDSELRDELVNAVRRIPRLAVAAPDDTASPLVATVAVRGGMLSIVNREGLPMAAPEPVSADFPGLRESLEIMAHARAMTEIHGEGIQGVAPDDLEIEWGLVVEGEPVALPLSGAAIGPGDRMYIKLRNAGKRVLFVHIFDVGISDRVALITGRSWSSGLRLEPGAEENLAQNRLTGKLEASAYGWPESVPREQGPRPEELVFIATTSPADLAVLGQDGVPHGKGEPKGPARLAQIIQQAQKGTTSKVRPFREARPDGILTKRVLFSASPTPVIRQSRSGGGHEEG